MVKGSDPMSVDALVQELNEMNTRQLARWLATPSRSGYYFSTADLQRIGNGIGQRISPHNRGAGFEQLLRGAALDEQLDEALAAVETEMRSHIADYQRLELPQLEPWIERAILTADAWSKVRSEFEPQS